MLYIPPELQIRSRKLLQCLCALLFSSLWTSVALAQAADQQRDYVLLRSGDGSERVLSGQLEGSGNYFTLEIAKDSVIKIPRHDVLHVAASIDELYEAKRASVTHWSPGDHFQMARWCIRNDLLVKATEHYLSVAERFPSNSRVRQLQVELKEKMLTDTAFRSFLGLDPPNSVASAGKADSEVPAVTTASTTSHNTAVSPAIMQYYAARVDPIFQNRCSQTACHGNLGTTGFKIFQSYARAHNRVTTGNMNSALEFVDSGDPRSSRLLRYATTAHGLQKEAGIAFNEVQLVNALQEWIRLVAGPVVPAVGRGNLNGQVQPAVSTSQNALTRQPPGRANLKQVPHRAGDDSVPTAAQAIPAATSDSSAPFIAPTMAEIDALDDQLRQILGEPPAKGAAKVTDPFDPNEFNRQATAKPIGQ